MTKHEQVLLDMYSFNQEMFRGFQHVHDLFSENPEKYKDEFNEVGQDVLQIIRKYENILCGKSESGKFGKFSSKLADKFWEEISLRFPKIDSVGVL